MAKGMNVFLNGLILKSQRLPEITILVNKEKI